MLYYVKAATARRRLNELQHTAVLDDSFSPPGSSSDKSCCSEDYEPPSPETGPVEANSLLTSTPPALPNCAGDFPPFERAVYDAGTDGVYYFIFYIYAALNNV